MQQFSAKVLGVEVTRLNCGDEQLPHSAGDVAHGADTTDKSRDIVRPPTTEDDRQDEMRHTRSTRNAHLYHALQLHQTSTLIP